MEVVLNHISTNKKEIIEDISILVNKLNEDSYSVEGVDFSDYEIFGNYQFDEFQNIKFDNDEVEKIYIEAMKVNGLAIRYINNPSQKVQLEAVSENGTAIQYIHNPSKKVIKTATDENKSAIKYLKNNV
jgi:hypothetical protein